jgi:hypothetical protein
VCVCVICTDTYIYLLTWRCDIVLQCHIYDSCGRITNNFCSFLVANSIIDLRNLFGIHSLSNVEKLRVEPTTVRNYILYYDGYKYFVIIKLLLHTKA